MELIINIKKIITTFLIVVVIFVFLHLIVIALLYDQPDATSTKILRLFHLDEEANFPTFYSSLLFVISSILLLFIARLKYNLGTNYRYWIVLSLIFLFLAADEIVQLHEKFSNIIYQKFHIGGIFRFSWWIVYALLMIILSVIYLKFFIHLPKRIQKIFLLAALIFISGSILLEIIGTYIYSIDNYIKTFTFYVISSIEETLEMIGLVIFIYGLLKYIGLINHQFIIKVVSNQKS